MASEPRTSPEAANARQLANYLKRASASALKGAEAAEAFPDATTPARRERLERGITKQTYAAVAALEKASALAQKLSDRISRLSKDL